MVYQKRGALNLKHFGLRAADSGDWNDATISVAGFQELLKDKINTVDLNRAKADISLLIPDPKVFNIWTLQYFEDLIARLKLTN